MSYPGPSGLNDFFSLLRSKGSGSFTFPETALGAVEDAFDEFRRNNSIKIDFKSVPPEELARGAFIGGAIGTLAGTAIGRSWQGALFGALIGIGAGAIAAKTTIVLVSREKGKITLYTGGQREH